MSPYTIQGLFHLYFDLVLFIISGKILYHHWKTPNLIGKYLGLGFFLAAIEYLVLSLSLFLFPTDPVMIRISGIIAWPFAYLATGTTWLAIGVLYPKFPAKMFFWVIMAVAVLSVYLYGFPFRPAAYNEAGLVTWDHPPIVIIMGALFFFGTFGSIGITFIYRTLKQKEVVKGLLMGLGMFSSLLFLPTTYQVKTFESYIFLSLLTAVGFTLMMLGVLWPTKTSPQQPTPTSP
ncbi:MAG TPA: hypothetical protein VJB91_03470 [Patescibacteria group bacterium]|nr:hypothetical protein [Patescibacteria group bacterium]